MCSYDSLFEIFEQITQHILFLGPSPRKRMQFLAALESSKRELTEIPYIQIKPTTLKYSLNKQYFFVVIIFSIGFGWGFYAYARTKNPRKAPNQWINTKMSLQYIKVNRKE